MVSFLVDQLPLCSTEGAAWIAMQIIDMMLHKPNLQASAQVLKPLVLHFSSTYSTVAGHVVFLLEVSCALGDAFRRSKVMLIAWHISSILIQHDFNLLKCMSACLLHLRSY